MEVFAPASPALPPVLPPVLPVVENTSVSQNTRGHAYDNDDARTFSTRHDDSRVSFYVEVLVVMCATTGSVQSRYDLGGVASCGGKSSFCSCGEVVVMMEGVPRLSMEF